MHLWSGRLAVRELRITDAELAGLIAPRLRARLLKAGFQPSDALTDALKQHVKEKLAPYKYPRWIEFVAELPKTATGKIQRFKLR